MCIAVVGSAPYGQSSAAFPIEISLFPFKFAVWHVLPRSFVGPLDAGVGGWVGE